MTPRYYSQTEPGPPSDWHELRTVGARRRPFPTAILWLTIGAIIGMAIAAVLR